MRFLKIYNPESLKLHKSIICSGGIALAAAYVRDFHTIALASSDKTMAFYDGTSYKLLNKFSTPDS